jgi:hypothetical protein
MLILYAHEGSGSQYLTHTQLMMAQKLILNRRVNRFGIYVNLSVLFWKSCTQK